MDSMTRLIYAAMGNMAELHVLFQRYERELNPRKSLDILEQH